MPEELFVNANDVRLFSDIEHEDMGDRKVTQYIKTAIPYFVRETHTDVYREQVRNIDQWHKNEVDGSNSTFYLQWPQVHTIWHVGDMNKDGKVDCDDINVEIWKGDGEIEKAEVEYLDPKEGKFVLSQPPKKGDKLFVDYMYVGADCGNMCDNIEAEQIVRQCVAFLTAALIKTGLGTHQFRNIGLRFMNFSQETGERYAGEFIDVREYWEQHKLLVEKINQRMPRKKPHREKTSTIGPNMDEL